MQEQHYFSRFFRLSALPIAGAGLLALLVLARLAVTTNASSEAAENNAAETEAIVSEEYTTSAALEVLETTLPATTTQVTTEETTEATTTSETTTSTTTTTETTTTTTTTETSATTTQEETTTTAVEVYEVVEEVVEVPAGVPEGAVYQGEWTITGYCPCTICCGQWSYVYTGVKTTASGNTPVDGYTVAAGKDIPFGTIFYVDGYGLVEVMDRGGAVGGGHLDLYRDTHEAACAVGKQTLSVYLVSMPE